MFSARFLAVLALVGFAGAPTFAQTTAPVSPLRPLIAPAPKVPPLTAPAVTAPALRAPAVAAPSASAAPASSTKQTNLNTATATELDALPTVGKARAKAIIAERAKGKFRDWPDFDTRMAGTSVNAGVKAKIKDHVTF